MKYYRQVCVAFLLLISCSENKFEKVAQESKGSAAQSSLDKVKEIQDEIPAVNSAEQEKRKMSKEGLIALEKHQVAFSLINKYDARLIEHANTNMRHLHAFTIPMNDYKAENERLIDVPLDLMKVYSLFEALEITGGGLSEVTVSIISDHSAEKIFKVWFQGEKILILKLKGLSPIFSSQVSKIRIKGDCVIKKIEFKSKYKSGISPVFDKSPYMTLGIDRPMLKVKGMVNPMNYRSIEGVCDFDRHKFMRLYSSSSVLKKVRKEDQFWHLDLLHRSPVGISTGSNIFHHIHLSLHLETSFHNFANFLCQNRKKLCCHLR